MSRRREAGIDQRPQCREEMSMRKVRLTAAVADAGIAALAQHAMAFTCDGSRVGKMMIDHRHEYEVGTAIPQRECLSYP